MRKSKCVSQVMDFKYEQLYSYLLSTLSIRMLFKVVCAVKLYEIL